MNNNNQFSRFNLFFRLTFIILLHPLFLPVPLLQGDFRCTPLGSCRLQLQEFKGTTLQSPFKHSFSRILETLDGTVTATPPFERPPGSSLIATPPFERPPVPNDYTYEFRDFGWQLEPLLPLSALQFPTILLIGTGGCAVHATLHATCQWLLLLEIGGSAVHATSCSNFLMVTAEPAGTFVWQVLSS
ncbi:uncharacterized protein HD556DRAFT_1315165 [Suillus plorans]|uniref:Uncharacterized protein n=1 Tax=Suillus plorans TaxID=116603 RepID=A0A9P7A8A4_9AGAM|nr:uncharacterized protein HD556DRAFT_1315165 [Suillus plorans]KAG1784339.1 hypothetical protein HD556DRAFT_1315165 [Suillus plorans]